MIEVLIVYMTADKKESYLNHSLPEGSRVIDALNSSGFYACYPEAEGLPIGVFSKRVTLDRLVQSGDRIEIYRPLLISPKERRRQRALSSKWLKRSPNKNLLRDP